MNSVNENVTKRLTWLDYGRGISIYLIILFHSEVYYPLSNSSYSQLFGYFRLPFFFFLSGYLFTSDYKKFSIRKKFSQVACRLVWTYFVFTSIILIPKSLANGTDLYHGICDILLGKASWFIVTLGGVYVMWAFVVRYSKSLSVYFLFTIISIFASYFVKCNCTLPLPYFFDCMLTGNFFVGLGLFYRIFEKKILFIIRPSWIILIIYSLLFFLLTYMDRLYLGTAVNIFYGDHNNFFLTVTYGVLGIIMMVVFVKTVPAPHWICYIGVNSLVFYYINGGVLRILSAFSDYTGITSWLAVNAANVAYACVIMMSFCACIIIFLISEFVNKFVPILTGDRKIMKKFFKQKWIV